MGLLLYRWHFYILRTEIISIGSFLIKARFVVKLGGLYLDPAEILGGIDIKYDLVPSEVS